MSPNGQEGCKSINHLGGVLLIRRESKKGDRGTGPKRFGECLVADLAISRADRAINLVDPGLFLGLEKGPQFHPSWPDI